MVGLAALAAIAVMRECGNRRSAGRVFADWMNRSCTVSERGDVENKLRRYASQLQPRLEEAFLKGPPPEARSQWLGVAERERKEVLEAIDAGKAYGLSREEIARLRARSVKPAAQEGLDEFVEGYRSAALAGLGVLGTPRSRRFLEGILSDPKQREYHQPAGLALKRLAPPRR